MTDRLLTPGYITRSVDPASRRRHLLELTDKGRTLLDGIDRAWGEVDAAIHHVLGQDSAMLADLARRLRNGMGGTIPGARNARIRGPETPAGPATKSGETPGGPRLRLR